MLLLLKLRRKKEAEGTWRRPTLPGGYPPSTIGASGLNCRVREGTGCTPAASDTKKPPLHQSQVGKDRNATGKRLHYHDTTPSYTKTHGKTRLNLHLTERITKQRQRRRTL